LVASDHGNAKVCDAGRGGARGAVELRQLVLGGGKADLKTFDFAQPPLCLGLFNAGGEVLHDLDEPVA
jgi:hypothetical protein